MRLGLHGGNLTWFLRECPWALYPEANHFGSISAVNPVYGELLFRQATRHATLLRPFLYVIDSKRALSFGEAQVRK